MKDKKGLLVGLLCALIAIMAVGYAAFATNLKINGTATITSDWCVRIKDNPTCVTTPVSGGSAESVTATASKVSNNTATVSIEFTQPGDQAVCTIIFENCGNIDAKLSELIITGIDEEGPIRLSVTGLTENAVLSKTTGTHTAVVTGKYDSSITSQPLDSDKTKELKVTANYTQNFN